MDAVHQEGGKRTAIRLLLRRGPQNPHTLDGLEPFEQVAGELRFPGLNRLQPDGLQIANRSAHAHRFADGWGASLELMGQYRPGAVVEKHVLNHLAATQERWHLLQQRFARPKEAHSRWAAELVGGAHQKINIEASHINWLVGQALAGIHQHQGSSGVGRGDHLVQGIAATQNIADVHQAHQAGAVGELAAEVFEIQLTGLRDSHMAQNTAGALGQQLPWHQIAVVLHQREQHLITLTQIGVTPAAGDEIDRLAGVTGEHDFARAGGTHELRRHRAGCFKGFGGPGTELMSTAMNVGVVCGVVLLQGLQHLARLLTGGGVIEVNQRTAIRRVLTKDREIGTISIR